MTCTTTLTHSLALSSPADTVKETLDSLNSLLATRTHLVDCLSSISLADLFLYATLHRTMSTLTTEEKWSWNHLSRWFDLVQVCTYLMKNDIARRID